MHFDRTVEARREVGERLRVQGHIAPAHRCYANAVFGKADDSAPPAWFAL